jgi:hypothetical protein
MGNLDTWDKISRPPPSALKKITGGRLNGKSDINPQWRMKAMTETFGPVGTGWKYTIDKLWTEEGSGGERMAFALVSVYTRFTNDNENVTKDGFVVHVNNYLWSDPVPGIGGSMMIAQEKSGLYNSDEAYKMAVTDALSVALKAFGMAAEIYMGNWDGSKYKDDLPQHSVNHDPKPVPSAITSSHPGAKEECTRIADELKLSGDERKTMFDAAGQNYSNLLIMLKAQAMDATLDKVFEAGK